MAIKTGQDVDSQPLSVKVNGLRQLRARHIALTKGNATGEIVAVPKEESDSIKGVWWLPDAPDRRVVGEFRAQGEDAALHLIGHFFDLEDHYGPSNFTVWGITVSGDPFTLAKCCVRTSSFRLGGGGMPTAEVSPSLWLKGGHYRGLEDVRLKLLSCDLTHLVQWIGHGSYSVSYERKLPAIRLEGKSPEPIPCATIGDIQVQWVPSLVVSPGSTSITFRNDCHLRLMVSEPRQYELLAEIIHGIAELIVLASELPVYVSNIRGDALDMDGGGEQTIEIFQRIRKVRGTEERLRRDQFLFTWGHVQAAGIEFVPRFFARRHLFRPVLEVLLSDRYNSEVYPHQRFLGLAHGIEAFHRVFVGGKYSDDESHQRDLLPRLLAALPSDIDSDYRRSLKNKFRFVNEYSLRKRVADVGMMFESILHDLIPDVRAFATNVADERNRLSHPDASSSYAGGRDLWLMAEQMSLLLELCLVRELGLGPTVENQIVTTGRHSMAVRLNLRDTKD
jgi:hypothetical protein